MNKPQPIAAVSAIVARHHGNQGGNSASLDNRVILVKRRKPPNQGLWVLPGGKIRPGESQVEAIQREIWEECGVSVKVLAPISVLDLIYTDGPPPHYHFVLISYLAEYVSGTLTPGSDAESAAWVSQDDLEHFSIEPNSKRLLQQTFSGSISAL